MPSGAVRSFSDPDDFAAAVRSGRTEMTVTGRGAFVALMTEIDLPGLWVQCFSETLARITHSIQACGQTMLSFRTRPGPPLFCAGIEMTTARLIRHCEAQEVYQRSCGSACWGAVSLPVERMATAGTAVAGCDMGPPRDMQAVVPSVASMQRLRQLQADLAKLAENAPRTLANPDAAYGIEQALLEAIATCLAGGEPGGDTLALRHQAVIMRRFRRALEARRGQAVFIPELCTEIGVSERALRACCREQLGMGPHRYLLLRRMHLARRALLHSAPAQTTVTEIATRYGFWQFGRFAQHYRSLFGELPSAALARSP